MSRGFGRAGVVLVKRSVLCLMAAVAAFAALPEGEASAERTIRRLMSMDHVLVRADHIAVVEVLSQGLYSEPSGVPMQSLVLHDELIVSTRWGTSKYFDVVTNAGFEHLVAGQRYLVLLSGGPWSESPFTHRDNSVFLINDQEQVQCSGGAYLYAVSGDGFYCAPKGTMFGSPLSLDEALEQLQCARDRAMLRLPELQDQLDSDPRPLEYEPSPVEELEVLR